MVKHFFLFSLVGLVLAGFLFRRKGGPAEQNPELAPPTVNAAGVTTVGALRLWQDYDANEVAADNRYKGKTLRVTGRVLSVERDANGAAVLDMVSGNPIFRTMATLQLAETQRAASLTRGNTVVVQCTGGGRVMRMPQLEDCELLQP